MATFDLGRVTPLYKGDYSASTSYELNDVVLYNGNLYWHVQATATVGILPTDTTVWKLAFADEGVRAEIRGYADSAQESAKSAQTSASAASASQTAAAASASTATTKASEAAASATSAQEYDESAQQSAINAQTSATNAVASAASAQGYSEAAAQSAEDAAESASRAEAFYYLPTDTAEGAIATFTDGADNVPVKSLVVDIDPVQDLHGQDSPYPAGGGKNVLPPLTNGTYTSNGVTAVVSNNNVVTITGTPTANANVIIPTEAEYIPPDNSYIHIRNTSAVTASSVSIEYGWTAIQNASLSQANNIVKISNPEEKTANRIRIYFVATAGALDFSLQISVESDSGTTAWSPYSNICPITGFTGAKVTVSPTNNAEDGESVDISFPAEAGTVYGSSLDVTNGVLTVDRVERTFTGDADTGSWDVQSINSYDIVNFRYVPVMPNFINIPNRCSNNLFPQQETLISVTKTEGLFLNGNGTLFLRMAKSRAETVNDLRTFLENNNLQLVYELATPIVYQLTPTEVKSLLGQNNVWADTGDTSVEYRADTSAYIAKKIAEAISALS